MAAQRCITSVRNVLSEMRAGASLVQVYRPRWPGGAPRTQYLIRRDGQERAVSDRAAISALRSKARALQSELTLHETRWWL